MILFVGINLADFTKYIYSLNKDDLSSLEKMCKYFIYSYLDDSIKKKLHICEVLLCSKRYNWVFFRCNS